MTQPVAVVTGGAGGIGAAAARTLADRGHRVTSLDRTAAPSGDPRITPLAVDVTDEHQVEAAVEGIAAEGGRVDTLVNCAAVLECYAVHDTPLEVWNRVLAVNVTGTFLVARACLPHLRRSANASIVNLSSVHAYASVPRTAAYAASKGAIVSLSRQMAVEYADAGIRVNALVVGSVETAMSSRHGTALADAGITVSGPSGRLGRMARPEEIAAAIAYLVSADASFVTGAAVQLDGGLLNRLM